LEVSYRAIKKDGVVHGREGYFTVMAIDVVEFTTLGDDEAFRDAVNKLEYTVANVLRKVRWDERKGVNGAILNFTGDGYFIGFDSSIVSDEDILKYAADISRRMGTDGLAVRIGINKGSCTVYRDLNAKLNMSGWGIIEAQRIMSLGDRNHILCTEAFAKDYINRHKTPNLNRVGSRSAKARELIVYNYYDTNVFGNKADPDQS